MKIALVHDQLQEFGGAERVFLALKKIYPSADIFTAFVNKKNLAYHAPNSKNWNIKTSWAARIPFFGKLYSPLRFLAPLIWESFDFTGYDLVISSSGWYMSKGIITKKPTIHISYVHHQPRYLYGYETAVEWQKYFAVRIYAHIINHRLRIWDFYSTKRPDYLIANSEETKRRIQKLYRRDSKVIYPPVEIPPLSEIKKYEDKNSYYVTVSRLGKAKHIDILIKAANTMNFVLKIIGTGRDEAYLKSIAGPTVEFLGYVEDGEFANIYKSAKAFLFASRDEEFGIAPVEAMGYGVPVIAYRSGGLIETVKDGENGYLYNELSPTSLVEKIKKIESLSLKENLTMRENTRLRSEKYSSSKFEEQIAKFVNEKVGL